MEGNVRTPAAHRGQTVLVLGILSLVVGGIGLILGPMAWIMGRNDLREMDAGRMDRSGHDSTNAGRICGMIATFLHGTGLVVGVFCCFAYVTFVGAMFTAVGSASKSQATFQKVAAEMEKAEREAEAGMVDQPAVVPNAPPQPPLPREIAGKKSVDLLRLVDPARDGIEGPWLKANDVLHCNGDIVGQRIQFPYEPPQEYDFVVTFSHPAPGNGVFLYLPTTGGGSFYWNVGAEKGTRYLLGTDPPTGDARDGLVKRNTPCTTVVQVRRTGVRTLVDGQELLDHKTDFADLREEHLLRHLNDKRRLGVGCDDPTVFHYVQVVEVTGKGKKR
jgi:hypothetical protein